MLESITQQQPSRSVRTTVSEAIATLASGGAVLVLDDADREDEGDLIFAAELATPELMAFLVRHGSGFVCVALSDTTCDRLALPPMHHTNTDRHGTAYRVAVDATSGVTTGISARDRARTARVLADPANRPSDLTRPGHLVPLAARPGGVLERRGHTEAAVDLARLAGLEAAGVLCEVVSVRDPGRMASRGELTDFAVTHGLPMTTVADLVAYRCQTEPQVERVVATRLPTDAGPLRAVAFRTVRGDAEHLALLPEQPSDPTEPGALPWASVGPVHIHVECVLGDAFGSRQCECTVRLEQALRQVATEGRGVVVYLRSGGASPMICPVSGSETAVLDDEAHAVAEHILRDLDHDIVAPGDRRRGEPAPEVA